MITSKMFTIRLKDNKTIQVAPENLTDFLEENSEHIQIRSHKMGKRRSL
jgi:hypothetical protein